ncbi:MAG: phenylalanine--tRNA ligase subunit alpha [Verrucomicrobia bacterium]|nr:phenylalanine--tRNA ligase subunit alpha [Verrucomicrobiota bacterium]
MNAAEIESITAEALREAEAAQTRDAVETVRIKYLGRKGAMPRIMKELKDLAPEERGPAGRAANTLKQGVNDALASRLDALGSQTIPSAVSAFDATLPARWHGVGTAHPISQIIREATIIFARLGFTVAEGPDIETAYHNFDALNTPPHHPSRDALDTFWFENGELLRTQTSPVQIRVMQSTLPPISIITPGRCYRRDTMDATHSANFHQIEGLHVAEGVSLADLKSALAYFAKEMMGPEVGLRFRPHFFPFTEPSVECDFTCHVCAGKGCRVCKGSGWIEIAGAGMVDPRVFERVGYDPDKVSGYAFGMGVERIAMVKYGIPDIRTLYENDLRFLHQFA